MLEDISSPSPSDSEGLGILGIFFLLFFVDLFPQLLRDA